MSDKLMRDREEAISRLITLEKDREEFYAVNKEVIDDFKFLEEEKEKAEVALKEIILQLKENIAVTDLGVRFVYSQPYKKTVDYVVAEKAIKESMKNGEGMQEALKTLASVADIKIRTEEFMDAVRDGELPNECRVALSEEPMSPRVSRIKIKEKE